MTNYTVAYNSCCSDTNCACSDIALMYLVKLQLVNDSLLHKNSNLNFGEQYGNSESKSCWFLYHISCAQFTSDIVILIAEFWYT